jgi:hypothetical protein
VSQFWGLVLTADISLGPFGPPNKVYSNVDLLGGVHVYFLAVIEHATRHVNVLGVTKPAERPSIVAWRYTGLCR